MKLFKSVAGTLSLNTNGATGDALVINATDIDFAASNVNPPRHGCAIGDEQGKEGLGERSKDYQKCPDKNHAEPNRPRPPSLTTHRGLDGKRNVILDRLGHFAES